MLFYFESIARLVVVGSALFSAAALAVSQLQPARPASGPRAAGSWESVSGGFLIDGHRLHLVDLADGRTATAAVPSGERWDDVSASPLTDGEGRSEAVGRFTRSWRRGDDPETPAYGLVRVRLPEAEVVERVGLDVLPIGRPAWNPAGDGQVLIPAGDGRLYSYRFGPRDDAAAGVLEPSEKLAAVGAGLTALEWGCQRPGRGEPYLTDPIWLAVPELRDVLIVSLSAMAEAPGASLRYGTPSFWWLKLDDDGERIVDAGPLVDPADAPAAMDGVRPRFPSVLARDGRLQLAFLLAVSGSPDGELRIGDLERRPGGGLRLRPASAVAQGRAPIGRLHASLDGRRLYGLDEGRGRIISLPLTRLDRIETATALNRAPAPGP
jgi:hypothetical protein